jgi:hypothetical protein
MVAGADPTRYDLTISDPIDGSKSFIYLFTFAQDAPSVPSSGLSYTRNSQTEEASIETSLYREHFASRWVLDDLRINEGNGPQQATRLIDRWKGRAFGVAHGENEETWTVSSTYLGDLSGPVRAIREVQGAASGTTTTYIAEFYPDRMRLTMNLRVHPVSNLWFYLDYLKAAGNMMYDDSSGAHAVIDGVNDSLGTSLKTWSQVSSPHGTLVHLYEFLNTDGFAGGPADNLQSFYADADQGFVAGGDGTGSEQPQAWGNHGFHAQQLCAYTPTCPESQPPYSVACCAPSGSTASTGTYYVPVVSRWTMIFLPGNSANVGARHRARLDQPVIVTSTTHSLKKTSSER